MEEFYTAMVLDHSPLYHSTHILFINRSIYILYDCDSLLYLASNGRTFYEFVLPSDDTYLLPAISCATIAILQTRKSM